MNAAMVKRLIVKDWYLQRVVIIGSLVAGALSLAVIGLGGKPGFILGLILLVTVLIGVGAQLAVATMVFERKEQTLSFVMSLPISYKEYTASKILGNLIIFLVVWLTLLCGSLGAIAISPDKPFGLVPFVAIMATEILVSTCLIYTVALTTEHQGWTIGAIITGNLALNGIGYYVAHIASIARGMEGHSVQWSPAASTLLASEFVLIVLMLGFTFLFQSRKKDFI
jgi:ABC-type transport system involved in multi-copper enzyme maturation permease subunit